MNRNLIDVYKKDESESGQTKSNPQIEQLRQSFEEYPNSLNSVQLLILGFDEAESVRNDE